MNNFAAELLNIPNKVDYSKKETFMLQEIIAIFAIVNNHLYNT
jgi:hypothetical protein